AIERPLVFPDNDRPGIMLADAARTYLQQYGVAVGRTIVIVGAHDNAYRVAQEMAAAGVTVAAVADIRPRSTVSEAARLAGLPVVTDAKIDGTTG
ncbi:ferredoxin, partial [Mycobacterium tuberculosis]